MTRVAVIGHVEWVQFVAVDAPPPRGGLVQGSLVGAHGGGGAIVAACAIADLGAEVELFCALGDDELGRAIVSELSSRGITVHAAWHPAATRSAFTMLDADGERTIVTVGERWQPSGADPLPWPRLAEIDGVYFTAGDEAALAHARRARALVITPRAGDHASGLRHVPQVDATVFSAGDTAETQWAADWEPHSRVMVATEGAHGGRWWSASSGDQGRWVAAPPPGPVRDSYGCGDAFAGGLTFALAEGDSLTQATAVAARCGAAMLTRVGAP